MNYERIDELLAERHMSRRQLALAAGLSVNNISGWFTRRTKKVPMKHIKAIADVLGVHYWELIVIDDEDDISSIIHKMISSHDELKTGFSDDLWLQKIHSLSIPHQREAMQYIESLLASEQESLHDFLDEIHEEA